MGAKVDPAEADQNREHRAEHNRGDAAAAARDHDGECDREREPADGIRGIAAADLAVTERVLKRMYENLPAVRQRDAASA